LNLKDNFRRNTQLYLTPKEEMKVEKKPSRAFALEFGYNPAGIFSKVQKSSA
jgi:hypothetical protein